MCGGTFSRLELSLPTVTRKRLPSICHCSIQLFSLLGELMKHKILFPLFFMILLSGCTKKSQEPQNQQATAFPPLEWSQEIVNQVAEVARNQALPVAKYPDGKLVGKESPEERKKVIIADDIKKKVVESSILWNTVQWCGLKITKHKVAWMIDTEKWNLKQRTFIAVLHGATTGVVQKQLEKQTCTEEFKSYLRKNYDNVE